MYFIVVSCFLFATVQGEEEIRRSAVVPSSGGSHEPSYAAADTQAHDCFVPFSSAKRGLAYNNASVVEIFLVGETRPSECGWTYNWDSAADGLISSLEFVPMLWAPSEEHLAQWQTHVDQSIEAGSSHILSFNECDISSQCNLGAEAAAKAHVKYLNPYSDKARIGSPAVSNSDVNGEGIDWLQNWVIACESAGCHYDFCNIHWYASIDDTQSLFEDVDKASAICGGRLIWITEFAILGEDDNAVAQWLGEILPQLDASEVVERYAYFMVSQGRLVSSSSLTNTGRAYRDTKY